MINKIPPETVKLQLSRAVMLIPLRLESPLDQTMARLEVFD